MRKGKWIKRPLLSHDNINIIRKLYPNGCYIIKNNISNTLLLHDPMKGNYISIYLKDDGVPSYEIAGSVNTHGLYDVNVENTILDLFMSDVGVVDGGVAAAGCVGLRRRHGRLVLDATR